MPVEAAVVLVLQTDAATAHANEVGAATLLLVGRQMFTCCLNALALYGDPIYVDV